MMELLAFLLLAASKTYAGKAAPSETPARPQSRDLYFEQGDWRYIDTYLGGARFAGEEAVFFQGKPVWAMNYAGRNLTSDFSADFLKAALLTRCEKAPFRGLPLYEEGDSRYETAWQGDMDWFRGEEGIWVRGVKAYECVYHGGRVE